MPKIVTWWPLSCVSGMRPGTLVLLRYDWPDERIIQAGIYDNTRLGTWHDGQGNILQAPDYFTAINDDVLRWLKIPPEQEYTYKPKKKEPRP